MFIVKGVCRVMKYPDVQAQIERKIAECDKTLNRIMNKYCFHHLLLETATKPADPKFMTLAEQVRPRPNPNHLVQYHVVLRYDSKLLKIFSRSYHPEP